MITETAGFLMTFVASKRPPSPTSTIAASAGCSENSTNITAVRISNTVILLAAIGLGDAAHRLGQHGVLDQLSRFAGPAEPVALVPAHQVRRNMHVHRLAAGFQQRAAEGRA